MMMGLGSVLIDFNPLACPSTESEESVDVITTLLVESTVGSPNSSTWHVAAYYQILSIIPHVLQEGITHREGLGFGATLLKK